MKYLILIALLTACGGETATFAPAYDRAHPGDVQVASHGKSYAIYKIYDGYSCPELDLFDVTLEGLRNQIDELMATLEGDS